MIPGHALVVSVLESIENSWRRVAPSTAALSMTPRRTPLSVS